ncbi:MAG: glycosyltransferase involved in cell wall biosynthesis [Candidatus Marinamargulisbacteria bacterium]
MGVRDLVRYIGFAPNEELVSLYRQSLALVMPTFLGPTNMPPLEAFSLGVPVLYSGQEDLKSFVSEKALLLDLADPGSFSMQLLKVIDADPEVAELVKRAALYIEGETEAKYLAIIARIFREYQLKMETWPRNRKV